MSNEDYKKAQVVSFLSGKGGAGKTSVSIGVAYLLNDAGFRVLLIDFDFATNGASYFYRHRYRRAKGLIGIYEIYVYLKKQGFHLKQASSYAHSCLIIREGLNFIPSRVNFSKKLPLRESIDVEEKDLKSFLLSLINRWEENFDFVIIDTQAGSNLSSKVSASLSNKVIIVSELDPISSDAVDTLLIQIGEVFPEYRRHLINKLDIRESEDYKDLSVLFQSMNRLPPLPFDFEVRSAFASRKIPIDVNKPTTFLIALFNTVKAFLPEYRNQVDKYGKKILSKFNQYQDRVNSLLNRKKESEVEIEFLRRKKEKRKLRVTTLLSILVAYLGGGLAVLGIIGVKFLATPGIFLTIIGAAIFIVSIFYLLMARLQYREKTEDIVREKNINTALLEINKEIDRYKSLMLTRTKEFLLHFEKSGGDMEKQDKFQDTELYRENLKYRILGCLYKWSIKGLEKNIIPEFEWGKKAKEWGTSTSVMERVIDEMVDDGDIEYSTSGKVVLTTQGKMRAREKKLDQEYSDEQCGKGD